MKTRELVFYLCFMLWPITSHAKAEVDRQTPIISVTQSSVLGAALQLQVFQASLRDVLDELSRVSGAGIHYSVVADERVTATCVGDNLKKILKCLLGDTRNIVFQFSEGLTQEQARVPVNIWVLGSSLAEQSFQRNRNAVNCKREAVVLVTASKKHNTQLADAELIAQLLLRLNDDDPKQRADAIVDLALKTAIDNADVHDALLHAMDDKSAIVREQALFGWVHRKGEDALVELQRALQDPDMSVRMKAVDLTQDRAILTLAISDSHKLVRNLAQMKLEALK